MADGGQIRGLEINNSWRVSTFSRLLSGSLKPPASRLGFQDSSLNKAEWNAVKMRTHWTDDAIGAT